MTSYSSYSDDFYSTVALSTEMDLPSNRETVIHYFEQLRKFYPEMANFYGRDDGEYVLEGDKDSGHYRWSAVESRRISSGYVNPASLEAATEQHTHIMESIPHLLSASPLDCESMTVMFGFDFMYQGNHHQLIADALDLVPAFGSLSNIGGARLVGYEPMIQFALDDDCRTQFRLSIEPRTNAFQIRTGEYLEDQLSVYLAVRRFGSLELGGSLLTTMLQLIDQAQNILDQHVVEQILIPLQQNISIK